jgi:SEC-C motif domain protein
MKKVPDTCPCQSNRPYDACCGRWHAGEPAPDAETLMRSRYVAFSLGNESYLLATWHSSTRPAGVPFHRDQKWLGLQIVAARTTGTNTAEVEFIARYRVRGSSAARHHEHSRFVREGDRWFYIDGDLHPSKQDHRLR